MFSLVSFHSDLNLSKQEFHPKRQVEKNIKGGKDGQEAKVKSTAKEEWGRLEWENQANWRHLVVEARERKDIRKASIVVVLLLKYSASTCFCVVFDYSTGHTSGTRFSRVLQSYQSMRLCFSSLQSVLLSWIKKTVLSTCKLFLYSFKEMVGEGFFWLYVGPDVFKILHECLGALQDNTY